MSSDEAFVTRALVALRESDLEVVVVGSVAAQQRVAGEAAGKWGDGTYRVGADRCRAAVTMRPISIFVCCTCLEMRSR